MKEAPREGISSPVFLKETKAPKDDFEPKKESPDIPESVFNGSLIYPDNRLTAFQRLINEGRNVLSQRMRLRNSAFFLNGDGMTNGHGEKVVLNCGFLVGDWSFDYLASWLQKKGYDPLPLPADVNLEPPTYRAEKLYQMVKEVKNNKAKIKLIGQSKGGYENILALLHHPDLTDDVDEVINLGSPTNFPLELNAIVYDTYVLTQLPFGDSNLSSPRQFIKNGNLEALNKVRITSILARYDGIIKGRGNWQGLAHQEIIAPTTHCALGYNLETYQIIGSVLSSREKAKAA